MNSEICCIVATIAFVLGIDKSNVRVVIHYSLPSSLETYHQAIGRAGRDGLSGNCVLYFSSSDLRFHHLTVTDDSDETVRRRKLIALNSIVNFCLKESECRRKLLFVYFGKTFQTEDCQEKCDVCRNCFTYTHLEYQDDAACAVLCLQSILSSAENSNFTLKHIAKVLSGSSDTSVKKNGHDTLSTCGSITKSKAMVEKLSRTLVISEVLEETISKHSGSNALYLKLGPNFVDALSKKTARSLQTEEEA